MNARRIVRLVMVWCLMLLPAAAWAQVASSTIAGVVKDTSGAVTPGVTVDASSPALIEQVRTVLTDDQGQYKIVDLRPGIYTVTFSLTGFDTVKREGLELTAAFTATVNVELKVGELAVTVMVSGASPVVDVQNVLQQQTLARGTLDALPTTKRLGSWSSLLPGATYIVPTFQDAGAQGEGGQFSIHGGRPTDLNVVQDGMNQSMVNGSTYSFNPQNLQEVVLETGGISAESFGGGVIVNIVTKDGGNTFAGSFNSVYAGPRLQSANLTPELSARGLRPTPSIKHFYDVGISMGGPILKNKLWFYGAHRRWGASQYQQGNYYNKTPHTLLYEPDYSRPAHTDDYYRDYSLRFTWQASPRNKIAFSYAVQDNCNCFQFLLNPTTGQSLLPSPEAVGKHIYYPNYWPLATWNYPATNRLLFEAGASLNVMTINAQRQPEVGPNDIAVTDLGTNYQYGSRALGLGIAQSYTTSRNLNNNQRFAVSYITGSHAFKTGFTLTEIIHGSANRFVDPNQINGARDYSFRNGLPVSVRIYSVPSGIQDSTTTVGAYVQDQWTTRTLTLNLGVRYDYFNGSIPEQHLPAGPFVPARDFPAVSNSPNWKNINPRLGATYDLFGTGKTAVKAFLGRYVGYATGATNNPVNNQAASATRTWGDTNGNFIPDCNLILIAANDECGALSDTSFGQVKAGNTHFASDALAGFNLQGTSWQGSVSLQHELRQGVALNVGYFRTRYGNFTLTDNLAVTPADYDPYCITAPVNPLLPGGGGNQVCGLYDIKPPPIFGAVNNLVTQASHYGKQTELFNGVDVTLNARFGQGGQLSGGLSVGRTVTDNCFVVDSPQQARPGYCHVSPPWSAGTQVKFLAVYPLPWQFRISATYQNLSGIPIAASYVATNAQILPTLNRNLGAGPNGTATIDLIPPNTLFEDRIQQVDIRFTRTFQVGKAKVRGNVDVYNLFNASSILFENTRYGSQWLQPLQIMGGRLFKFGVQLDY